jgi:multicomponent Na+:H+ antiporter subunit B
MTERRAQQPSTVVGGLHRPWLGAAIAAALFTVLVLGMVALPREGAALPTIARHALAIAQPTWGTTEAVNEIVYGSRGFDTFGETFILIGAVLAVTLLARSREARGEYVGESAVAQREQEAADPGESQATGGTSDSNGGESDAEAGERDEAHGTEPIPDPDALPLGRRGYEPAEAMTVVVRTAARAAAVIVAVLGVYIAAWGYSPGGGFPGGVVVTGVVILLYAALGRGMVRRIVRPAVLEPIELVFGLLLIGVGVMGIARSGSMFANWVPLAQLNTIFAGGNQQVFSGIELVEVAVSLTIAVFALLGMGHDWAPDEDEQDESEE